jgi:hypothetical protein
MSQPSSPTPPAVSVYTVSSDVEAKLAQAMDRLGSVRSPDSLAQAASDLSREELLAWISSLLRKARDDQQLVDSLTDRVESLEAQVAALCPECARRLSLPHDHKAHLRLGHPQPRGQR